MEADTRNERKMVSVYNGPRQCAQAVDKYFKGDREKAHILDVAAGTGLVGEQLVKKGFKIIDGVEPSTGMIEQAMSKDIYRTMYDEFFTPDVKCLKTSSYDILVMVGALGEGHFPVNGLPEMARCVKPGENKSQVFNDFYETLDYVKWQVGMGLKITT